MTTLAEQIRREIRRVGMVTFEIQDKYFSGLNFVEIRDQLESLGLDRHMLLAKCATEVALKTPQGILMQVPANAPTQLSLWGGMLEYGETPEECAIRELFEKTGLRICEEQLELYQVYSYFHKFDNGDRVIFKSYRYVVRFDTVPEITLSEKSSGSFVVSHVILSEQRKFVQAVLDEN